MAQAVVAVPGVDSGADFLLRWTESIAQKVKRKRKVEDQGVRKEILHSVFEPAVPPSSMGYGPVSTPSFKFCSVVSCLTNAQVKTLDHNPPMTQLEWDS